MRFYGAGGLGSSCEFSTGISAEKHAAAP